MDVSEKTVHLKIDIWIPDGFLDLAINNQRRISLIKRKLICLPAKIIETKYHTDMTRNE